MKRLEQDARKVGRPKLVVRRDIADLTLDDQNRRIRGSKRTPRSTKGIGNLSDSAMPGHIRVLVHDGEDRGNVWRRLEAWLVEVADEER